jgi:hypothetical protein
MDQPVFNRYAYLVKGDGSFVATLVRSDETNEAFAASIRPDLTVVWERPPEPVSHRPRSAAFPGINRKRRRR